jgi:hypothetical protein
MAESAQSLGRALRRKPSVRPVSQVALRLTDSSAFENAIAAAVRWMNEPKRCNGHIPDEASDGAPFSEYGQRAWITRMPK